MVPRSSQGRVDTSLYYLLAFLRLHFTVYYFYFMSNCISCLHSAHFPYILPKPHQQNILKHQRIWFRPIFLQLKFVLKKNLWTSHKLLRQLVFLKLLENGNFRKRWTKMKRKVQKNHSHSSEQESHGDECESSIRKQVRQYGYRASRTTKVPILTEAMRKKLFVSASVHGDRTPEGWKRKISVDFFSFLHT